MNHPLLKTGNTRVLTAYNIKPIIKVVTCNRVFEYKYRYYNTMHLEYIFEYFTNKIFEYKYRYF